MNNQCGWVLSLLLVAASADAAPWDVRAEVRVAENGVVCGVSAGFMLLEKLCSLELREADAVSEEEIGDIGEAVARAWPELVVLEANGNVLKGRVERFGIAGKRREDGSYERRSATGKIEVSYECVPPMQSLRFEWKLLPERFFESGALDDLIAHLEPRDRSAIVELSLGEGVREELEMRRGQEDFAWERAGESLPAKIADLPRGSGVGGEGAAQEPSPSRGRTVLLVILGGLLIVRLAMANARARRRRR